MNKPTIELKNWYIDNYTYRFLYGNAYRHCKFEDGTFVRTSQILNASIINLTNEESGLVVETHNSIYTCNFNDAHEDNFSSLDMFEMLELCGNDKEVN